MNPSAEAFVPKKRSPGGTPAPATSTVVPAAKLADNSKLRAGASAFVPKTFSANAPEYRPNTPNAPGRSANGSGSNSQLNSPNKDHKFSPEATPYTPTRKVRASPTSSGAPQFPSVPAPGYQTAISSTTNNSSTLVESQFDSTNDKEVEEPSTPASPQKPEGPTIDFVPFEGSKLLPLDPVSSCPESLKFNSSWTLHCDDHPTRPQVQIGVGAPANADAGYNPVEIQLVSDMESFWRLWRHVPPPSKISSMLSGSFTYYWFRKDIKPSWEDFRNKNGGTISFNIWDKDIPSLSNKNSANDAFFATLMMITGESVPESTGINGIVCKLRKNGKWKMELWTAGTTKSSHQAVWDGLKAELVKHLPAESLSSTPFFPHSTAAPAPAPAPKRKPGQKPVPPKFAVRDPMHTL